MTNKQTACPLLLFYDKKKDHFIYCLYYRIFFFVMPCMFSSKKIGAGLNCHQFCFLSKRDAAKILHHEILIKFFLLFQGFDPMNVFYCSAVFLLRFFENPRLLGKSRFVFFTWNGAGARDFSGFVHGLFHMEHSLSRYESCYKNLTEIY